MSCLKPVIGHAEPIGKTGFRLKDCRDDRQTNRVYTQTLSKVRNPGKYIRKHGDDPFISQTISKMPDYKIRKYDGEIKKLDKDYPQNYFMGGIDK
ncbi:MAG TPA: hypothetical protein ENH24_01590 [Nitrospirae bacterium]|nr:hypothetical protein [Nitrospirota bacterium]